MSKAKSSGSKAGAAVLRLTSGPVQRLPAGEPWETSKGAAWAPAKLGGTHAARCEYVGKRVLDGAMYGVFKDKEGHHYARPMAELMAR